METEIVYLIDEDVSVQRAMSRLFREAGIQVQTFSGIECFDKADIREENACVVADFSDSSVAGVELLSRLSRGGLKMPVIFLSSQEDEFIRARAHQSGAAGYFRKPVDDQALIDSIRWALSEGANEQ